HGTGHGRADRPAAPADRQGGARRVQGALRSRPRALGPQRILAPSGEAERARAPQPQGRYAARMNRSAALGLRLAVDRCEDRDRKRDGRIPDRLAAPQRGFTSEHSLPLLRHEPSLGHGREDCGPIKSRPHYPNDLPPPPVARYRLAWVPCGPGRFFSIADGTRALPAQLRNEVVRQAPMQRDTRPDLVPQIRIIRTKDNVPDPPAIETPQTVDQGGAPGCVRWTAPGRGRPKHWDCWLHHSEGRGAHQGAVE